MLEFINCVKVNGQITYSSSKNNMHIENDSDCIDENSTYPLELMPKALEEFKLINNIT